MLGLLLVRKPLGITSHDAVNRVRRIMHTKRVGHAGTLDPLATGLLVVAVGPATRFLQYLPLEPKEYVADIRFGMATSTYDAEGEVTFEASPPDDLEVRIRQLLPQFEGLVSQVPPMHSAVKIAGRPLYSYARQGQEVAREARTVHFSEFDIQSVTADRAVIRLVCSGGTYVRSFAHDLGVAMGVGAHLVGLVRTRVGRFRLEDAIDFDEVSESRLISLQDALPPVPLMVLDAGQVEDVRHGRRLMFPEPLEGRVRGLMDDEGRVIGMARVQGNFLQPECVIPAEVVHG